MLSIKISLFIYYSVIISVVDLKNYGSVSSNTRNFSPKALNSMWKGMISPKTFDLQDVSFNEIEDSDDIHGEILNKKVPKDVMEEYQKDAHLTFKDLAVKYNYPVEEHIVVSKDGYILTIFRIPHGRIKKGLGPPVIMMHGFTDSSDSWIFPGPGYGLGYLVADAGYDVWFPNYRGNLYSRKHLYLDPDRDGRFWEFSYDEMAKYDLPAITDYILDLRNVQQLSYVGFSQGTTIFFAMSAHRPEYYKKFNLMVALAPVAWLTNLFNPHLRRITENLPQFYVILKNFGVGEFLSSTCPFVKTIDLICSYRDRRNNATAIFICRDLLFEICGPDEDQFRYELVPVIYGHSFRGASLQNAVHLGQGVRTKKFQRFDWGAKENFRRYGSIRPPQYNVSSVTTPVVMMYGRNDWLTSPVDIKKLRKKLPNVVDDFMVPKKRWQHVDHVWGKDAPDIIGTRLIRFLHQTNKR